MDPRKYHCVLLVGPHLVVHGGVGPKNRILSDLFTYHTGEKKWSIVTADGDAPALAYHACQAVYSVARKTQLGFSFFKTSKAGFSEVKNEGIYFYGGLDEHGEPSAQLY